MQICNRKLSHTLTKELHVYANTWFDMISTNIFSKKKSNITSLSSKNSHKYKHKSQKKTQLNATYLILMFD